MNFHFQIDDITRKNTLSIVESSLRTSKNKSANNFATICEHIKIFSLLIVFTKFTKLVLDKNHQASLYCCLDKTK